MTMLIQRKAGTTDVSVVIRIIDSATGVPETAVEHNTSGIDLQYRREGAASTAITEAALAALTTAHTDGGIEHIGNGYYRLDLPDAACASGVTGVLVHGTITDMVVVGCYVQLVAYDPFDTVRAGLTALPNAAADAAGGLPISDAGGLDLDAQIGTDIDAILADTNELQTDWANGGRLDLIVDGILEDTGTTIPGTITTIDNEIAAMQGNVTDILTDTGTTLDTLLDTLIAHLTAARAEPTSVPAANATLGEKVDALYMAWRNGVSQTATTHTMYQDDGSTVFAESTVADNGTTFTRSKRADP